MLSYNHLFKIGLIGSLCGLLAGCLQPMYGGLEGGELRSKLAAVRIEPIPERLGHYLSNELGFGLNGTGSEISPLYKLSIAAKERVEAPLVDTVSGRATAANIVVDASYKLFRLSDGALIADGVAFSAAGYDRSSQRFANIRAARDAEIRDAKNLADQIKTRLAAALQSER